jgi:hypothetical protein
MQHSFEKLLFITLLVIFAISVPDYLNASETDELGLLISQVSGERKIEQPASGPNNPHPAAIVTIRSRGDIYQLLFGIIMAIIGLLAVALALYRWKAKDLSLISFGVFCFVYGARTRAFQFLVDAPLEFWEYWRWFLVYLTPLPAYIFFEQFIGKGWKSSIRRIWQIQIVFVVVAVSVGLTLRSPGAAMVANNVMAIVGILVLGINLFGFGLHRTRELRVLKSGIVIFGIAALIKYCAVNWKVILSPPVIYSLIRKNKSLHMPERDIHLCYCGGDRNKKSLNIEKRELF